MDSAEDIFVAALEIGDPVERERYLESACGPDRMLRDKVEALLQDSGPAEVYFSPLRPEGEAGGLGTGLEGPGSQVGRYRLREKIGEGGYGVVYLAQQTEPVVRLVALKLVKPGMDTAAVIARFDGERQSLAVMDHPCIARVFDAGMTPGGRPFFVMERVVGRPITEYCDAEGLGIRERLELFIRVCQAVQHAHQKGIIHRDLKPSNILIETRDGVAMPKNIDFGIAKAIQGQGEDRRQFTGFEQFLGTPAYASPEQVAMANSDIDTRSDIYSLGVLLYELLTGTTPFDVRKLIGQGLDELRRTLRERDAVRPSARLQSMEPRVLNEVASKRRTDPARLIRLVRGDLDWIVIKAVERDRRRRYETANGLAADLRRHLDDEPVGARPPGRWYRMGKAVARNRLAFASVAVVAVVCLTGAIAVTWMLVRERRAHQRAVVAEQAGREQLWHATLASARATRRSASPGQRLDSLAAIADAAKIQGSLELRNEAIAALALTDIGRPSLGGPRVLGGDLTEESPTVFDRAHERVAYFLPDGGLRVESVKDASHGVRVPPPEGDPGSGYWLGFSPDGRFVAARYASGVVACWELEPLRRWVLDRLEGAHWVSTVFSMDSAWLVAGTTGHLRAYALTQGQEPEGVSVTGALGVPQRTFEVAGLAGALAFEGESRYLAVVLNAAAVRILDWRDGRVVTEFSDPEGVTCLAWHPDSRRLLTGSGTGAVRVWDTLSGSHRTLTGHRNWIHGLALHPRGDLAASQSWDGTTKLWDLAADRPLLSTEEGHALEFSGDGQWLGFHHAVHQHGAWPVAVSRVFRELRRTDAAGSPGSIDFSPDGRLLVWTDPTGVWRLDLRTGWYARRTRPDVAEARFSADGKWLVLAGAAGLERWALRQESDRGLGGMELVGEPQGLGTNRFEMYRCQIGGPGANTWIGVTEWNPPRSDRVLLRRTEVEARLVESPTTAHIISVGLSGNDRWLALGHHKGDTFVLDPLTGGIVHHWPELKTACVGFTPDGTWLVTGTGQRYQAWRPGTWQAGWTLPRENAGSVGGLMAFANDGRTLAVLKSLGTMELLDWRTGETLASLTPPRPQEVFSATFSPDGGLLAVLGDSEIQIWDLDQLRTELASLGLDWSPPAERTPARSTGDLVFRWAPDNAP